jgi:hypothetical protein
MAFPIKEINSFAGQNWVITPAAPTLQPAPLTPHDPMLQTLLAAIDPAVDPRPQTIPDQKWLLTLSGVALVGLKGESAADWLRQTLILQPTVIDPLRYAVARHSIPRPPGVEGYHYFLAFQVEQLAPYASISSIFNQGQSVNSGFAVDVWRPNPYDTGRDAFNHQHVDHLWTGLQVDVAVRDTDAYLYRVGYNITLLGKICFIAPETLFLANFEETLIGEPPAHVQRVGTAEIQGPPGSVTVQYSPDLSHQPMVRIKRPDAVGEVAAFRGLLLHPPGPGVYTFQASMLPRGMSGPSRDATIRFETAAGREFLRLDFVDRRVRIDQSVEFGHYNFGERCVLRVTLTIDASPTVATTADIVLFGWGAFGGTHYTIILPEKDTLSRQFGSFRISKEPSDAPASYIGRAVVFVAGYGEST